ncbi:cytochrome P460 family protein [Phaeobacter italicus]|uniref:cytochrome P460 family protein n=1 Tax=Phaeobacter italicus TaxID=481446 RepID=UPI0035129A4A
MKFQIGAVSLALVAAAAIAYGQGVQPAIYGFDVAVDDDGNIKLPDLPFRETWTQLGTWSVNAEEGAEGMHMVYTQPGVVEAYKKTGAFPDGAVLVKELRGAETEDLTTGRVSYASELQGWFVMVKDSTERYPDNALWGDGWGWGFFEASSPQTLITEDYKAECLSCHLPAKDTDWIYTRAYPALR